MKNVEKKPKANDNGVEYLIEGDKVARMEKVEIDYKEEYNKKLRSLQIIAAISIMIILLIFPLRLLDNDSMNKEYIYISIGFITSSLVPSIIAIFDFMPGRRFCLFLSVSIFGMWIVFLSSFFWELILLLSILIIFFEIVNTIQKIESILKKVEPMIMSGAYYHANVFLKRYLSFLLKFSGSLLGISFALGILGQYVFTLIQGDILFSVFMIICLILILIFVKKTFTSDAQKLLIEENKKKEEDKLAKTHSKFS